VGVNSRIEVHVAPRFCDTQGMVHASRYHEFLEDAFLQWLHDSRFPYGALRADGLDLVVGTANIRYRAPGRLGDLLRVTSRGARSTASTVTVDFTVAREELVLAEASITYVAVRDQRSAPLPSELAVPAVDLAKPPVLARLHAAQALFYTGGSSGALEEVLHPDVSWHVPGRSQIAGDYVGRTAVLAYMARRRDLADRTFRMRPGEVLVGPAHLAVLTGGTAVIAGVTHEWQTIGLYQTDREQIREAHLVPLDQEAFDRIWGPGQRG
jgi:YbgC/YbaW family acyl-CoA thioester hydrolase